MRVTGQAAISHDVNTTAESDLSRGEAIGIPVALIVLLIVFGTLVSALLPIGLSLVAFVLSIVAIATGGEPQNDNSLDVESGRAFTLMSRQLPTGAVTFTLILADSTRTSTDAVFQQDVARTTAPLAADHRVVAIETPYNAPAALAPQLVSSNGHVVLAVVSLNIDFTAARRQ